MPDHKKTERMSLFSVVIRNITGNYVRISPAPPRQALKMFGGYLTIDEFRKKHIYCKYLFKDIGMDNFTFPEFFEISNVKKSENYNKKTKEQKRLRLQRPSK